jgi:molybdopterin-containing oxidoreductase family membrane subunit
MRITMKEKAAKVLSEIKYLATSVLKVMFLGGKWFYVWMTFLTVLVLTGIAGYVMQVMEGLAVTHMREQVSWGFYISNFTFFVGVAAAAVLLIIPAYLYHFKSIKKIVALGELLAITAVLMAIMFVLIDIGRPDRLWHMTPAPGTLNFPDSILVWDMIVLNGYLFLNIIIAIYLGTHRYVGKEPNRRIILPLILLSIPLAVGVHTVTAFVYNGMAARPFWNASILAPRFLASAFCSGPALMIIIFQVLRKVMKFRIDDSAIFKLAEIIAYAMAVNLFLLSAEIFKEYYSDTHHLAPLKYLLEGLHGHNRLVPWIWTAMFFNVTSFILFLIPKTREKFITLNIGCVMIIAGIWIEKGMGLVIPGFIPDALGEIFEYMPSMVEVMVSVGVLAIGSMVYTLFVRAVIALDTGRVRHPGAPMISYDEDSL